MDWLRRMAQNRLLDVGAVVIFVLAVVRLAVVLPGRVYEVDFNHYYAASRMLWEGTDPYLNDLAPMCARYGLRYAPVIPRATNTPAFLWLLAPLTVLPPAAAFAVWTAIQAGCLIAILMLTRRLVGERLSNRAWRFVYAAAVVSAPVFLHLGAGQMQLLLAALLLAAHAAHRQGHETMACLGVAVAGLLKLFPFALLPWFIWRGRRGVGGRLAAVALTVGTIVVVVLGTGPERWVHFYQHGLPVVRECGIQKSLQQEAFNQTLPSFLIDIAYVAGQFHLPAGVEKLWQAVGVALGLAAIALAYVVCARGARDEEREYALLSTAVVVGTPVAWAHYFVFLIFPLVVLAARIVQRPTPGRVVSFFLLAVVLVDPGVLWQAPFWSRHHLPGVLVTYAGFYGAMWLGLWLAQEARRP